MKPTRTINQTALALIVGSVLGLLPFDPAISRDTDVYFSNPNAQQQSIKPNIMLIVDTSGSMNTIIDDGTESSRLEHMKDALNSVLDSAQGVKMGLMRFSSDPGGPVLFPIADLDAIASSAGVVGPGLVSVEVPISINSDDAEQAGTAVTLNGTSLDMDSTQVIGLRFQSVSIPKGVTISSAFIKFDTGTGAPYNNAASYAIKGQKAANPPTFTTAASDVSSRTAGASGTTASVAWNNAASWTTSAGDAFTADISPIVSELTGASSDWCRGGSMVFTIQGSSGLRAARSRDSGAANAPVLVINYDPATIPTGTGCVVKTTRSRVNSNNDDAEQRVTTGQTQTMDLDDGTLDAVYESTTKQVVGLRFAKVNVPKGATILDARIDLTANNSDSSSIDWRIVASKTATPGGFTGTDGNISSRIAGGTNPSPTVAVDWNSVASGTNNAVLVSPNLSTIIAELTDNSTSWVIGNPMVFVFQEKTGTNARRRIYSHEGDNDKAPLLRVTYQTTEDVRDTVRYRLKTLISAMRAEGSTPIVDSLYEAGLYYRGQPVDYGKIRGPQSGASAKVTRVSHPGTYTGGSGVTRDPNCTDSFLSHDTCVSEVITGTPTYKSPFDDGCQASYIVLLTDGDPTVNNSETKIETLIGAQCAASSQGDPGKCGNELAQYYFDNNLSAFSDLHNITTHTIGFASDGDPAYLQAIATAGHGTFKAAGNASELASAFEKILAEVNSAPTAFVSPSLSVNAFNKLFNRDEVYFSLFSPQLQVRWPGNVKKFKLCNDSSNVTCTFGAVLDANNNAAINTDSKIRGSAANETPALSIWSSAADGPTVERGGAGERIPARASRNVYTYTNATDLSTTPVNSTNVTKTMLGNASMTDARRDDIIAWMLGKDVMNEDGDSPVDINDDRWKFADALHSRPLTITYGGTSAAPVIKLLVGTNDGALRLINTNDNTGANGGKEEWAVYIPDFLSVQEQLMDNAQGVHVAGMDGTPTAYVIDHNQNGIIEPAQADKVYVYIGQRRGGKNIWAFDLTPDGVNPITDPTEIGRIRPKFLWRLQGGSGSFAALGQTWSRPVVTKIRVKCNDVGCNTGDSKLKTVLMFAGGYDPALDTPGAGNVVPPATDSMGNGIYIVDPLTGALVWRAGGPASGANLVLTNMTYAIPSDLAIVDANGDGATDRVYVGDSRGQLWRIDLGNQIDPGQAGDGGSKGYVFANIGGAAAADKRKFFYPPEVVQAEDSKFSNNPSYDLVVVGTGDREDPLDKLTDAISATQDPVNNRLYAFRDYNYKAGPYVGGTPPPTITAADMYDATVTPLDALTGAALDSVRAKKGWYLSLRETSSPNWVGEKALAKAVVFGGTLMFTTFVPQSTVVNNGACAPLNEGVGRLYVLNYLSAGGVLDFNNDGTLDRRYINSQGQDVIGGGIPSEAVIVIREGGVTTLVGTSGGAANPNVGLKMPRYNTYWYEQ